MVRPAEEMVPVLNDIVLHLRKRQIWERAMVWRFPLMDKVRLSWNVGVEYLLSKVIGTQERGVGVDGNG
jgi:hypothetical protein